MVNTANAPNADVVAISAATLPWTIDQRAIWDEHFSARYRCIPGAAKIWNSAGIDQRHAVIDPRTEDVSEWSTGERMERYQAECRPLGLQAITGALALAKLTPQDIDLLVVVSCTGYSTPGLDLILADDAGMSSDVQRLCIGHMGCYASLPALATVSDAVVARGMTAIMLSAELSSLHAQPACRSLEQLVAHALFSDAVVASVVRPGTGGLRLLDTSARTDSSHQDAMTWRITDHGFRMTLSARVPAILARHVRPVVEELLARHGLAIPDVAGWAVHPGGPKILDVCQDALGLQDSHMSASVETLRQHGNCSSATVLLVLERMLSTQSLAPGDHVVALAFGPGLTLYASLFVFGGEWPTSAP
ncbi:MAG: type III polyketide synthase [Acidimicrobiales bacterium]